jgi:hypothetical protein
MARANRLSGQGGIFHVTHRCHNREFLLKFALDRDGYRTKLRDHLRELTSSGTGDKNTVVEFMCCLLLAAETIPVLFRNPSAGYGDA